MGINPYGTQTIRLDGDNPEWPLMLPADAKKGRKPRKAVDVLGDCQCAFCDEMLGYEGDSICIGKKCKSCKAHVVAFTKVE